MKTDSDLFDLIQSLTPYEKGFCRKYLGSGPGKKAGQLLDFFAALAQRETYEEAPLKAAFSSGRSSSHFSVLKNTLFQKILEALAQYHEKNSELSAFFKMMRGIEILNLRGMKKACLKQIAKAEKMLPAEGYAEERLLLHKIKRRIFRSQMISPAEYPQIQILADEGRQLQAPLNEKLELWEKFARAQAIFRLAGHRPESGQVQEIQTLAQNLAGGYKSPEARLLDIEIQLRKDYLSGDPEKIFDGGLAMLKEMDQYADRILWDWHAYFHALMMVINGAIQRREFAFCLSLMQRSYSLIPTFRLTPKATFKPVFRAFLNSELTCWARLGRPDMGLSRLNSYSRSLMEVYPEFPSTAVSSIFPNAAWIFLLAGDFSTAMNYCNIPLGLPYIPTFFGEYHKLRVIQLCILYHLEDFALLESALESFRKYVSNRRSLNAYDRLVIRIFKVLLTHSAPNKRDAMLSGLLPEFQKIRDLYNPLESAGIAYFPLDLWVRSLIGPRSFAELSQEVYPPPSEELENFFAQLKNLEI